MEVIILAGGQGTRLRSEIKDRPKVMAEINGKPFLEYTFNYLQQFDIQKVILAVGYKKEWIKQYFGNKYKKLSIFYSEESMPLDTGGAVKKALQYTTEEDIIVMNGDIVINIDLKELYEKHKCNKEKISATIAVKKLYNYDRYNTIIIDNEYVKKFKEKEYVKEGYINIGMYVINKYRFLKENIRDKFSIEKDYFEKQSRTKQFFTYMYDDVFLDIGIPEDYHRAKKYC